MKFFIYKNFGLNHLKNDILIIILIINTIINNFNDIIKIIFCDNADLITKERKNLKTVINLNKIKFMKKYKLFFV